MASEQGRPEAAAEARATRGRLRAVLDRIGPVRVAALLSALWLICLLAYATGYFDLLGPAGQSTLLGQGPARPAAALDIALFVLAGIGPVALFLFAGHVLARADAIRTETVRLTSAIDALRHSVAPRAVPTAGELAAALTVATRSSLAEEKEAMAAGLRRLDDALSDTQAMMDELRNRESDAKRADKKTAPPPLLEDRAQPALPLETDDPAPVGGIPWASVVRALDFPKDERDREGFEAIRQAVADREIAELLQAAEDTLTLLSEDGLYMEDLEIRPAPLPMWRRYADGARGGEIDAIGGVDDEVALAIARGKVKNDPVFRDTAMHFLRRFDKLILRLFNELGDDPIVLEAAESRTGRAFMVISRVMGVFDGAAAEN